MCSSIPWSFPRKVGYQALHREILGGEDVDTFYRLWYALLLNLPDLC